MLSWSGGCLWYHRLEPNVLLLCGMVRPVLFLVPLRKYTVLTRFLQSALKISGAFRTQRSQNSDWLCFKHFQFFTFSMQIKLVQLKCFGMQTFFSVTHCEPAHWRRPAHPKCLWCACYLLWKKKKVTISKEVSFNFGFFLCADLYLLDNWFLVQTMLW